MTRNAFSSVLVGLLIAGFGCDGTPRLVLDAVSSDPDACTPACQDRECGPDGCGGLCGRCGNGLTCLPSTGKCEVCHPVCDGRECGTNGCGGTCGTCAADHACDPVLFRCTPTSGANCATRECGDDGQGGSCGTCPSGQACSPPEYRCVGASCGASADCAVGLVCQVDQCRVVACAGPADCRPGEICVNGALLRMDALHRYCTATQCTSDGTVGCPGDKVCNEGFCEPVAPSKDVIEPDAPGPDDAIPGDLAGDTHPADPGTPPTDPGNQPTDPGNQPTDPGNQPTDPGNPPVHEGDCRTCTTTADCGNAPGWSCLPVGPDKHCLRDCATDGDCPASYICYAASTARKACLPVTFRCPSCAVDAPCEAGTVCDFQDDICRSGRPLCGECFQDYQCAAGFRCFRGVGAAAGRCVPECDDVTPCADTANFACGTTEAGVRLCQPTKPDQCGTCGGSTPFPSPDGTGCYACLNNSHCPGTDVCNPETHACTAGTCALGHVRCAYDGLCHMCCEDSDCAGREGASGTCTDFTCDGVADPCMGGCVAPFAACAEVGGTWLCVECTESAHCAGLGSGSCTCSGSPTFGCLEPDGSACATPTCAATCSTDADCPPDASGAGLYCSGPNGICYHPKGSCDGASSCCPAGSDCYDMMGLLMGSGLGGMPGTPMPMVMAYCSCSADVPCLGGLPCTSTATVCAMPMIGDIMCPGGALAAGVPDSTCVDMTALLTGILGGI